MAGKKNIAQRWMAYGFSMIVVALLIVSIVLIVLIRSFYYERVQDVLEECADLYRRSAVFGETYAEDWTQTARLCVESFDNKEQMELQVLSANGSVVASTTGFVPTGSGADSDFAAACVSAEGRVIRSNRNSSGEHVMALTAVEKQEDGKVIGALRYVVTLRLVDRQLWLMALLIGAVVLVILFFCALSGLYFIRSIVHPVDEIGRAARRIAKGEYAYRVVKRSDDELGELCDTINYMAGEIQRSEQLKNEFISSVSHELRTPLTAIRGWSETLRSVGMQDPELSEKGMSIIAEEADRLSGMVEELLDFSRMQNGKLTLQFETVDIPSVLEEIMFLMQDRAEKKDVRLQYAGNGPLPAVMGDADRLRQVFINVLDNAIKYSDAGDTVRVDYALMDKAVQVVFGDTGTGISEEDLPQIKRKFYKADMTRPGSGIGLAVADEIISGHGGSLEIHSKQGVGTSVIITLPCQT